MSRPEALGARLVLLLGLAAAAAPSARAGEEERFVLPGEDGRPPIQAYVRWGPPPGTAGGWGWVWLQLENGESVPRAALVTLTSNDGQASVRRHVPIPPGGSAQVWLPVLGSTEGGTGLSVEAPGHEAGTVNQWRGGSAAQAIVGSVGAEKSALMLVEGVGKAVGVPGATRTSVRTSSSGAPRDLAASQIPGTWTYLSSLALLHVDGTAAGLDAGEPQRSIAQYVGAGGSVLVTRPERLPAGPLRDLVGRADRDPRGPPGLRTARRGLGACWVLDRPGFDGPAFERFVHDWQRQTLDRTSTWATWPQTWIGIAPLGFRAKLRIPGLGALPIRLFFLLILAFAVLVGPVAYVILRRRRQLTKMLWFVPSIGLGFAGAILLYGLLSEGLGTKGVVRSLTVLDQRSHEAFGAHSRTLYAGVSPAGLRVSPDTVLDLPRRAYRRGTSSATVRVDLDEGGRWTGEVLPSRTPTAIQTVTQGRARERLRFRRGPDGTYEVLAGEGFQPVDAEGALLLHAPDGTWHGLERRGHRLVRLSDAESAAMFNRLTETLAGARMAPVREDYEDRYGSRIYSPYSSGGLDNPDPALVRAAGWAQAILGDLPQGAYLGWMTSAPGFDDLGLDVDWVETRHLVMGLLASEDLDG